jgi:hypothetical protein
MKSIYIGELVARFTASPYWLDNLRWEVNIDAIGECKVVILLVGDCVVWWELEEIVCLEGDDVGEEAAAREDGTQWRDQWHHCWCTPYGSDLTYKQEQHRLVAEGNKGENDEATNFVHWRR